MRPNVIVHGCNVQGVMGSGFAHQVAMRYPTCYETYRQQLHFLKKTFAEEPRSILGQCIQHWVSPDLVIVNAITQQNFGRSGRRYVSYRAVAEAFAQLRDLPGLQHGTVHYPQIGAGLGGGDWSIISEIISNALDPAGIHHVLWLLED
jgi:O-acetyl-ADP-ribose deacetylase (regulator of RNase III)